MGKKLVIIAVFYLVWTSEGLACELSQDYRAPSILMLTNAATYVVEATFESRSNEGFFRFIVHRWHKGDGPSSIEVAGFGTGPDCKSSIPKERAIPFLFEKVVNGHYWLNDIGPYSGTRDASGNLIKEIKKATSTK